MELQGKAGPQSLSDGAVSTARMTKQGGLAVTQEHAPYAEAAARGVMFTTSNAAAGVTVASTDASPCTANTGTGLIVIGNPVGSGKNLVILKASIAPVSGTPGGGFVFNYIPNVGNITATQSGTINNNLLGTTGNSVCKVWNHTALTASSTGVMVRPISWGSAIAYGVAGGTAEVDLGGDLVVPPGVAIAICAVAAGTSHVVSASLTWEEVPV